MLWILRKANGPAIASYHTHGSAGPATCLTHLLFSLCHSLFYGPLALCLSICYISPLCSYFFSSLAHFPFAVTLRGTGSFCFCRWPCPMLREQTSWQKNRKIHLSGNKTSASNISWSLVATGINMYLWEVCSLQINSGLNEAERDVAIHYRLWSEPAGHHPWRGWPECSCAECTMSSVCIKAEPSGPKYKYVWPQIQICHHILHPSFLKWTF